MTEIKNKRKLNILVAFDVEQIITKALQAKGHNAYSTDNPEDFSEGFYKCRSCGQIFETAPGKYGCCISAARLYEWDLKIEVKK